MTTDDILKAFKAIYSNHEINKATVSKGWTLEVTINAKEVRKIMALYK